MKFFGALAVWSLLSRGAIAQQTLLDRLPECAIQCFKASLPTTSCSSDNMACLCSDVNFMAAYPLCFSANCTVIETMKSTNETRASCGIPIRDQVPTLIGVTASFGALAVLMVILRLINRGLSTHSKLGWDDLLIGLSGLVSVIQNVPCIVSARYGFGRDIWAIPPDDLTASLKWMWVTYWTYGLTEVLCQLSICAFYLRILTSKPMRILVYVLIGLVFCFGMGNTFSMMLQCQPISFFWTGWRADNTGKCTVNVRLFGFIRGGIEIVLDLVILTLPLPMLFKLQMTKRKKIQIISMFCIGFVITIVSCLRLWSLVKFGTSTNPTYDNTSTVYWCMTESNLFIIVACMPAMQPIISKLYSRATGRTHKSSGYGSQGQHGQYGNISGSDRRQKSAGSLPFGVITKSTDVNVYRTERSSSDVELVDRPALSGASSSKT